MHYPWKRIPTAPQLPPEQPTPDRQLGDVGEWFECADAHDAILYVTFQGTGRPPDALYTGWLYLVAAPDELMRWPTLEEIYSAAACCPLTGVLWELPPFIGSADPESVFGASRSALLQFRQRGAVQNSPAFHRFQLSAGAPAGPQGVN